MVEQPIRPASRHAVPARATGTYVICAVLLLAPFVALLWVSSYAKVSPRLFGFPFFYWYQLMWVLISAVCTYVSYVLVRRVEPRRERLEDRPGGPR
ncbi:MAG: rane protein [Frankiales bacterium]|nr:rane protein [Frankiales bacterium]